MKIFLNSRVIEFCASPPEKPLMNALIVEYQSARQLQTVWEEFFRYDKTWQLLIIEPAFESPDTSQAFTVFKSFFKVVQAAGGLVKNEKGEFLFIHRLGYWDLPKGKIDKGDIPGPDYSKQDLPSARTAAIREVCEETGLKTVEIVKELPATWHIYADKGRYILKKTRWFEMTADSGQPLIPETREGIFLVKWTPKEAFQCILLHTYASIKELLLNHTSA